MEIICIEAGPILTNCYIVIDSNKVNALIVDTALNSADLLFEIINRRKIIVEGIILTHSHWDHSGDASKMQRITGAPVMVHKDDENRLLEPNSNTIMYLPFIIESCKPDRYLNDMDIIKLNDIEFEIRHTPGHTEGGICLINHKEKIVFAGDTIFNQSVGRTDLPGGSTELLLKSIKEKIMSLNDDYILYCGHGPSTTVGEERLNNPFLNENSIYWDY